MIREINRVLEDANTYSVFVPMTAHGNFSVNNGLMFEHVFPETMDIAVSIVKQISAVGDAFAMDITIADSNKSYSRIKGIIFGVVTKEYTVSETTFPVLCSVLVHALAIMEKYRLPDIAISLADFHLEDEQRSYILKFFGDSKVNIDLYL